MSSQRKVSIMKVSVKKDIPLYPIWLSISKNVDCALNVEDAIKLVADLRDAINRVAPDAAARTDVAMVAEIYGYRSKILLALDTIQQMPCGGIGPDGATKEEISEAHSRGDVVWGDAEYDVAQRVYLILADAMGV